MGHRGISRQLDAAMADADLTNLSQRCDELAAQGVEMLRFSTPDMLGRWRGKSMGITCAKDGLRDGVGIFSGSFPMGPKFEIPDIPMVFSSGCPSVFLKPASDSITKIPWSTGPVAEVICEPFWADGSPVQASPRGLLSRQLKELRGMGYELLSGFECEFTAYFKDTMEAMSKYKEYCHVPQLAKYEDLLCNLSRQLRQVDIHVETCEMEYCPGQFEFAFRPEWGITSTDNLLRFRGATRAIFDQNGFVPTFMSRPFDVEGASNGMHFNHSLWDLERTSNAFSGKGGGLSDLGRHWVGGLLKHAHALTALCSPTINCYRRLNAPWTPCNVDWGNDRFATIRVMTERGGRVENRIVSGSADPYTAAAATLAAGMDGIRNRIEPPPVGRNAAAPELPHTLQEAMSALEQDAVMVAALGEEFLDWWKWCKSFELEQLKNHNVKQVSQEELEKERSLFFNM